jgi:hypothetical protein
MKKPLIENGLYKHYKGNMYKVVDIVLHTETSEWMVLYCSAKESNTHKEEVLFFVRPYEMFIEDVEIEGELFPRFTQVRQDN